MLMANRRAAFDLLHRTPTRRRTHSVLTTWGKSNCLPFCRRLRLPIGSILETLKKLNPK